MESIRILFLVTAASAAAISSSAQSLLIDSVDMSNTENVRYTTGYGFSPVETVAVGNSISEVGISAWADGSYIFTWSGKKTYNTARSEASITATASGGDTFGRMAVTMDYTDFGDIWQPAYTEWYAQTLDGEIVVAVSAKNNTYAASPTSALRVIDGDRVTLGIDAIDFPYGDETTGIGHGSNFRIVNSPNVTISGGSAAWSVLDGSAADTDPTAGIAMVDRNSGLLSLNYSLQDLSAQRGMVQSYYETMGSPFQDDVLATLTLQITGENAAGVTDTFTLGTFDQSVRFSADSTLADLDFGLLSSSLNFDPSEWADGDFTLDYSVAIEQLAFGHNNAYLDSQVLGTLSASQSFSLFTGASAVPEPSTYAAILGFVAFGAVIYTRRKTKASTVQS